MEQRDPAPLTDIERERIILRQGIEQDSRLVRGTGFFAMGIGMVLILMIGAIAYFTVPIMLAGEEGIEGSRFTGGTGAMIAIFAIYAGVAAIGFTVMLSGAVHIATGKRWAPGLRLMSIFLALVVGVGLLIRALA